MEPSYVIIPIPYGIYRIHPIPKRFANVVAFGICIKGEQQEFIIVKSHRRGFEQISHEEGMVFLSLLPNQLIAPFVDSSFTLKRVLKKDVF